jgi:hypothetical protein
MTILRSNLPPGVLLGFALLLGVSSPMRAQNANAKLDAFFKAHLEAGPTVFHQISEVQTAHFQTSTPPGVPAWLFAPYMTVPPMQVCERLILFSSS